MMVIKHTVCLITSSRNLMRISGTIIVLTARLSAVASSVGLSCTVPEVWLYSSVQFCAPRRVGSLLRWPAYCLASPPRARRAGSLLRWPANCLAPPCRYDSSYSTGIIYQLWCSIAPLFNVLATLVRSNFLFSSLSWIFVPKIVFVLLMVFEIFTKLT
jgi:hypothetical protein